MPNTSSTRANPREKHPFMSHLTKLHTIWGKYKKAHVKSTILFLGSNLATYQVLQRSPYAIFFQWAKQVKETIEMSLLAKMLLCFGFVFSFIFSHHSIFPFPQWGKMFVISYFEAKWPNWKELYLYFIFSSLFLKTYKSSSVTEHMGTSCESAQHSSLSCIFLKGPVCLSMKGHIDLIFEEYSFYVNIRKSSYIINRHTSFLVERHRISDLSI